VSGETTERGLLDTSVVVVLEDLDPSRLSDEVAISTLTLAELTAGPIAATSEAKRARRQDLLQRVEGTIESLDFDPVCARAFGPIYSATREIGRKPRGSRTVDLMIAATARAHRLPLYTLNGDDFRGLDGLVEVVDLS
jgi:predicted nucleic acid-binding protein